MSILYRLYDCIIGLIFIVCLPYLVYKRVTDANEWRQRLGHLPNEIIHFLNGQRPVWIHAASVGELSAVKVFIDKLNQKLGNTPLVVSTMTRTGQLKARNTITATTMFFYLPLDLNCVIKRCVRMLNPRMLILVETELWPNLIRCAKQKGAKIILVNGRVSSKSFPWYCIIKRFTKELLSYFDLLAMQTYLDRQRIITLGAPATKVKVVGSYKFDLPDERNTNIVHEDIYNEFNIPQGRTIIIAGSTRPGEEEIIIEAYLKIRDKFQQLFLIIAPRHVKRIPKIKKLLIKKGLKYSVRSQVSVNNTPIHDDILLIDTIGELATLYSIATLVFIGGSLVPLGGHNPLEPARYKLPVLFGPYMFNCQHSVNELLHYGGGIMVHNTDEIAYQFERLLTHTEIREQTGKSAWLTVKKNQGASQRTIELLIKNTL